MINFSADNSFVLKQYWVDRYSDGLIKMLSSGENIKYSFSNEAKTQKLIFSDQRILIEEKDTSDFLYSFIGYDKIDFLQIKAKELDRYVAGIEVNLVLHNGHYVKFSITDDISVCELQDFLTDKIL